MRFRARHVQAIALAGAVGLWSSSVLGQATGLGKGHRWFLKHGLQVQGMANVGDPFNLPTYQAMNYTAINWLWNSSTSEMGPAPGTMPWARWVSPGTPLAQNSTDMPPIGTEGPYMSSLIALSLGDEPDLNNPTIRDQYVTWFNNAAVTHPNQLLYMNNYGGQVGDAALGDFIARGHPDMISFDTYPYFSGGQPAGGSPTNLYGDLRRYRQHAKGANIPMGSYRQTYYSVTEGRRVPSESELRLLSFGALAFNAKYLTDFTYNTGASAYFNNAAGGDNSPNALYFQAAEINREVKNLGPALVRLKPVGDAHPDYTTGMMFIRGRNGTPESWAYNPVPIGFTGPTADTPFTDWAFGRNDPYLSGWTVTNVGTKNNGLQGDVIVSWFDPLDEWFDGDDYTGEKYLMVTNGLADSGGTGVDTRQEIVLTFGSTSASVAYPYSTIQMLNPDTGNIDNLSMTTIDAFRKSVTLTIDGGTGVILKFPNGAPFVGTLPPDAVWTNPGSGTFSTSGNWDIGVAPAGNYLIHFGSAGSTQTNNVTFSGNVSTTGGYVHGGAVTWNLGGGSLSQTGVAGLDPLVVGMRSGENGSLTITNGTVNTAAVAGKFVQIGKAAGAVGRVTIGTNGNWNSGADLLVGRSGTGTIDVSGSGSSASFPNVYLGGTPTAGGGVGVMNVNAGTVNVAGAFKIWNTGAAQPGGTRLSLTGGTLNVGTFDTGGVPQRFGWTGGTLSITGSSFNLSGTGPLGSILSLTGTKHLKVTQTLTVTSSASISEIGGGLTVGTLNINPLGTYTRSGGTLAFNTINQTGGTFNHNISSANLIVAAPGGANYNLSGGSLNVNTSQGTRIGTSAGNGTFTQTGGSHSTGSIFLGFDIGSSGTYNLGPGGTVTASNVYVGGTSSSAQGAGSLNVSGGTMTVTGALRAWTGGSVTISGGTVNAQALVNDSTLMQTGGSSSLGSITGQGTLKVTGGTSVGSAVQQQGLQVANSKLTVLPNGGPSGTSFIDHLTISGTGNLDLNDNDLVVNLGDLTTIRDLVLAGFGSTLGISSSTSTGAEILALFDNALVGSATWAGQTIGASAIVGKYTYMGDVNIDGQVTGDDYTVIDANLGTDPAAGIEWLSGDANMDGIVTGDDYTVIDANLGQGVGNPLGPSHISSVPEPAGLVLVSAAATLFARRRGRTKSHYRKSATGMLRHPDANV